jgi:hypothetical protein
MAAAQTQAAQVQELLDLHRQLVTVQLQMARELVQLRADLRAGTTTK